MRITGREVKHPYDCADVPFAQPNTALGQYCEHQQQPQAQAHAHEVARSRAQHDQRVRQVRHHTPYPWPGNMDTTRMEPSPGRCACMIFFVFLSEDSVLAVDRQRAADLRKAADWSKASDTEVVHASKRKNPLGHHMRKCFIKMHGSGMMWAKQEQRGASDVRAR